MIAWIVAPPPLQLTSSGCVGVCSVYCPCYVCINQSCPTLCGANPENGIVILIPL